MASSIKADLGVNPSAPGGLRQCILCERRIKFDFCCRCQAGDRIGCGVKFEAVAKGLQASMVPVFFTRNGKEVPEIL